ncbi:putative ribonuclease Nob1, ribonuclease, PIN domain-containing protein [Rosa chinensis]|uniref:Putative ribonuclease Nob1, ribonuclease, PIN domain-containing protein n=1 Tax=Rosa chinensis TaxID=74649 RepID=A0A2P6P219_ROSCH|nr:RNA-binding NOB1-like protein isoform X2 [Rosa chinensis]PRQ15966.1 putative ribonuclease Nob1, ribonuclease, PIN domain-containing protein [Rosa chinensis]
MDATVTPAPASSWSNIVKKQPDPKPQNSSTTKVLVESCKSSKGIAVAVVDANAIIQGGETLAHCADKFVSIPEVIDEEVRDPISRHRLALLPFQVHTMEPSPEYRDKVEKFARATGDYQSLSGVDIRLIAMTYTLEAQIHGTEHLRDCPPPVHTVNVRRLPEKDLPGWENNVPNLEEWEALENKAEDKSNSVSRIRPLKDINLNVSVDGSAVEIRSDVHSENQEGGEGIQGRYRRYFPKKKEINIEGKMVSDGIDASQGQVDDNTGDWMPAVSRSTHRRFLRRKARRESYEAASADNDPQLHAEENTSGGVLVDVNFSVEGDEVEMINERLDHMEISSDNGASVDTLNVNDDSSEQSWMLRSLYESSVACITSDFAMQNVILQMGLRLLAPGGMQIRQLKRWILKCHACNTLTNEIGRMFCPKCGNGGTLCKVAVTVGENGITLAARKPRIPKRGTRYSLPLPQGGRNAITKNPVLREDQLPQKYLHPKTKKKSNKPEDDDLLTSNDFIFIHHSDKKAPLQPPVRKALAAFSGRRNPNDNHYSHSKH